MIFDYGQAVDLQSVLIWSGVLNDADRRLPALHKE